MTVRARKESHQAVLRPVVLSALREFVDQVRDQYQALERAGGVPVAMHRALAQIGRQPGITPSQLAAAVGARRSALSHTLRMLRARGWVVRAGDAADHRVARLRLSGHGERFLRGATARAAGTLERLVAGLEPADLRAAARLFPVLAKRVRPEAQPPRPPRA